MRISNRLLLALILVIISAAATFADEGMWPLYSVDQLPLDYLRMRGLKLQPSQIYNTNGSALADAIVQCGGATGSFVSPDGLILTNHHVAFGAVQEQSTVEHNYLRDGFYAPTRDKEIEAIGYKVYVTQSIRDVTKEIKTGLTDKLTDIDRFKTIDMNIKKLVKATEKNVWTKAKVASMFGGKQYMLYTTLELRDIRMVYIPPEAIGNYGGETDNWMWPRHVGDFSFLRAYVGPDGNPADYSPQNVPYHPKVYLPWETKGVKEGDFAMTIGFPGNTSRHISSFDMANRIDFSYPHSIQSSEDQIGILTRVGEQDSAIALRLSSDLKGIYNGLKKSRGVMEGFSKGNTLAQKRDQERQLIEWLSRDKAMQAKYGFVLKSLDSLYNANKATREHDFLVGRMNWGCDYLRMASTIYRWACEREKADMQRDRGFQDRDTTGAKERLKNAQINLVPVADKEVFRYYISRAVDLPADQQIAPIQKLFAESNDKRATVNTLVDEWFSRTKMGETDQRLAMFAMSRAQLEKLDDPFINLAKAMHPEMETMRQRDKTFSGAETRLAPLLIQAMSEWKQATMYPDANGTMRLSYGEVKGYVPHDATVYHYLTGLKGVMEKETGKDEFIVPDSLKTAFRDKDFGPWVDANINDIPVDFLTTNDITNGNSGSPVISGEGKLIGIAFDGNWEGVASDFLFNPDNTRTIACDARYIMFVIDRVYHLDELVKELNVTPSGRAFHHLSSGL